MPVRISRQSLSGHAGTVFIIVEINDIILEVFRWIKRQPRWSIFILAEKLILERNQH